MAHLQTQVIPLSRMVCSLYKRAARNLESFIYPRSLFRIEVTLLRARFDKNSDVRDLRIARQLYLDGEQELKYHMHPQPMKFPTSPGGIAYARVAKLPDWLLDYWDPIEKAAYPKYFALREKRKREYVEAWEKKHGPWNPDVHS